LRVQGVRELHGATHAVVPDRIETGTYLTAAAITGGEIELIGGKLELIEAVVDLMTKAGVAFEPTKRGFIARRANGLHGIDAMTEPFPGFPTDMQAQLMVLLTLADGSSMVTETVFENRFMHVLELRRLGADIGVDGHTAVVKGVPALSGAPVMASDLRASAALVLAGLVARGTTEVQRVYHLDRGYERLEAKLEPLGARIRREKA
jgi:UDP-N-acetylglucosamine 1-carboxyvinyltransferase